MGIYYVMIEGSPQKSNPESKNTTGAYIDVWVKTVSRKEAIQKAIEYVNCEKWDVIRVEEAKQVNRDNYTDKQEFLESYEEACKKGLSAFFYTWNSRKEALIRLGIIIAVILIPILLLIYHCRLRIYNDYDKYIESGGIDFFAQCANNPYDFKCAIKDEIICKYCACSFSLSDEDFDNFVNEVAEKELLLSKGGSASTCYEYKYYGIKVGEINELNYINSSYYPPPDDPNCPEFSGTLDDFNHGDFVNNVTDKPIDDYTVILYRPHGIGTSSSGLFADPETHRIVYYHFVSVR